MVEHLARHHSLIDHYLKGKVRDVVGRLGGNIQVSAERTDQGESAAPGLPDPGVDPVGARVQLVEYIVARIIGQDAVEDADLRPVKVVEMSAQVGGGAGAGASVLIPDDATDIDSRGGRCGGIVIAAA